MRLLQLQRPVQAAVMAGGYRPVLASFALPTRPTIPTAQTLRVADGGVDGRRYASVKSQGAYRIPNKKTIAKKLGAKRSGDQFVIPGNIIFKQRGTIWHAGFNALRGRDHTIHAAATGYVKYYRDPSLHPNKQYIGVAFEKEDTLPYPKNEPRRRKLGMNAHVRKTGPGPRPAVSDIGIPNRVLRKAGLYNIKALERRLWNADKKRALKQAAYRNARDAKRGMAGLPETTTAVDPPAVVAMAEEMAAQSSADVQVPATDAPDGELTPTDAADADPTITESSGVTNPDSFSTAVTESAIAKGLPASVTTPDAFAIAITSKPIKGPSAFVTKDPNAKPYKSKDMATGQPQRYVTTGEYLQKSWQERRHTKVLLLNPRNYSYAESNAAIGRLSSKTMYTPPWKLGGRKSRFRSRRKRMVARIVKRKSDKEFVRVEKEKERIKQEKRREEKLAKQRARGRKVEEQAAAAEAAQAAEGVVPVEVQASEPIADNQAALTPVQAQASEPSTEIKEAMKPAQVEESAQHAEAQASAEPAEAKETEKPTGPQKSARSIETGETPAPTEAKSTEDTVTKSEEKPTVVEEIEKGIDSGKGDKSIK